MNIWLESVEYELGGAKYWLKRGQITKSYMCLTYCCEYIDEILEELNNNGL